MTELLNGKNFDSREGSNIFELTGRNVKRIFVYASDINRLRLYDKKVLSSVRNNEVLLKIRNFVRQDGYVRNNPQLYKADLRENNFEKIYIDVQAFKEDKKNAYEILLNFAKKVKISEDVVIDCFLKGKPLAVLTELVIIFDLDNVFLEYIYFGNDSITLNSYKQRDAFNKMILDLGDIRQKELTAVALNHILKHSLKNLEDDEVEDLVSDIVKNPEQMQFKIDLFAKRKNNMVDFSDLPFIEGFGEEAFSFYKESEKGLKADGFSKDEAKALAAFGARRVEAVSRLDEEDELVSEVYIAGLAEAFESEDARLVLDLYKSASRDVFLREAGKVFIREMDALAEVSKEYKQVRLG